MAGTINSKKRYLRTWCSSCNDFKLFYKNKCNDCDSNFIPFEVNILPENKVNEQIKRYKESKKREFNSIINMFTYCLNDMNIPQSNIIESDLGYEENLREKRKKREQEINDMVEFAKSFENLERNDKCSCGSNKKYKKCHLEKVNEIKLKFYYRF